MAAAKSSGHRKHVHTSGLRQMAARKNAEKRPFAAIHRPVNSQVPAADDDSEFTTPGNQGEMNRVDLLTVLEHEIGHILGYDHTDSGLMSPTLATGIRETPTAVIDQFFAGL